MGPRLRRSDRALARARDESDSGGAYGRPRGRGLERLPLSAAIDVCRQQAAACEQTVEMLLRYGADVDGVALGNAITAVDRLGQYLKEVQEKSAKKGGAS
jgi:hypothetical protein